ncbi:hypothetical protein SARC_08791 [Sphaeroforma arctica JP610]|uniref:AMMECR1 domain-containing protein n=1 Tax=Sphaeroforma arctica JP610 TaxID=667725 RepID=A0A0L0FPZ4_9EUKA|nr:hypothetical protein SARC_08791 [Sphaeroforma arctica JP610]KNC78789.1 hypothetical protein SARC_08791 [Sphaeroforma arctica JP610]|eukprot:XP_014152691.1 hypothetical protein SARC_08791 [Sphaeroforma arctica JP610]
MSTLEVNKFVTPEMCMYCFDVLNASLHSSQFPVEPRFQNDSFPLFVTWKIVHGSDKRLRGCIGTFSKKKLHLGLKSYALSAALEDSRFDPVTATELPSLQCTVSLLIDFEKVDDCMDWEIGIHGIWIEFKDHLGMKRTATYLPEVMSEQGWTRMEALESLLRKGGHVGRVSKALIKGITLTRYKSEKTSMTYGDYVQHHIHIREQHELPLPDWITVKA